MPCAKDLLRRWQREDAAAHDHSSGDLDDDNLRLSMWDDSPLNLSLVAVKWGVRKREALALWQVRFAGLHDVEDIMGSIESQYETEEGDDDPASLVALRRPPQRPDGYFKGAPLRAVVIELCSVSASRWNTVRKGFEARRDGARAIRCVPSHPRSVRWARWVEAPRDASPRSPGSRGVWASAAVACREAGDQKVEGAGEACSHAAEITARVTGYGS